MTEIQIPLFGYIHDSSEDHKRSFIYHFQYYNTVLNYSFEAVSISKLMSSWLVEAVKYIQKGLKGWIIKCHKTGERPVCFRMESLIAAEKVARYVSSFYLEKESLESSEKSLKIEEKVAKLITQADISWFISLTICSDH